VPSAGPLSRGSPVGGSSQTTAPPIRLEDWRKACRALDSSIAHRTKPLNAADPHGRAERSSKPCLAEMAYVIAYNIGMNATAGYPAI